MKKTSNKQYAKALFEATKGMSAHNLTEIVNSFLGILQRDHRLKKIEYIIEEFVKYSKKAGGIKEIEVESARKLEPVTIEKIRKVFGAKSEITETINKDLIGGLRLKVDDVILDASIKNQLQRLKQTLTK
ncbi:MAG: F0F1 ATP synthase subunit delta [Patescibacteria group bacterium]